MATFAVKNLRIKLGLSQQQFATLVGSSVKTISNWENGGVVPASKIPQLEALAAEATLAKTIQTAEDVEGGNAQAQGDGASAEVNTDSAALIALIATYQQQIEKMQAEARAEREKILDDARKEREFLYSLIKEMKP